MAFSNTQDFSHTGTGGELTAAEELNVQNVSALSAAGAGEALRKTSTTAYEQAAVGGGDGATTALDNLASVAINTALLLGTSDAAALGSATKMWSDLFLASGAVVNFNNGNATITHSAGLLTANVDVVVPDEAYDATAWNGSLEVPTKNAIRDKIEALQPLDAELTALAGLTSAADKVPYFTGSETADVMTISSYARTFLDDANEATLKATLNLEANTDYYAPSGTDVAIADGGTGASTAADAFAALKQAASDTATGVVELATTAETETGTDATRAVTPDGLHDMTTLAGAAWFLDEDDMTSDSATKVPSQQSVKAYVDANGGGGATATVIQPLPTQTVNGAVASQQYNTNTKGYTTSYDIPFEITVTSIDIRAPGTISTAGTFDIGVYSENGQTKHIDVTTASVSASGIVHTAVASVTLPAGRYYFVLVPNSTADVEFTRHSVIGVNFADTGEPILCGYLTVTASTLPATFNPSSDITYSSSEIFPTVRLNA